LELSLFHGHVGRRVSSDDGARCDTKRAAGSGFIKAKGCEEEKEKERGKEKEEEKL
jgi:hypothetical protein